MVCIQQQTVELLQTQGEQLDIVEANIDRAETQSMQSRKQLTQAATYKTKAKTLAAVCAGVAGGFIVGGPVSKLCLVNKYP